MPCRRSRSTMCSMTGLLATGARGLGRREVSGRNRDPSPPAITTAFMCGGPLSSDPCANRGGEGSDAGVVCEVLEVPRVLAAPIRIFDEGSRQVDLIELQQ